jgi:hypothetical protein
MAKTLLLVWSSPTSPDAEDTLNQWYDGTHIPELRAALPLITAVNRYTEQTEGGPTRYLTVYEWDEADVAAAQNAFNQVLGSGSLTMTDTIDMTDAPPVMQWHTHR